MALYVILDMENIQFLQLRFAFIGEDSSQPDSSTPLFKRSRFKYSFDTQRSFESPG